MHLLISTILAFLAAPSAIQVVLLKIGSVVFLLGVLVFVHELGHYAVAKLCGVRVEVFSLGFGKRLWGFRRGDTDYRISILPLGGYVKMAGENPLEDRTGDPGEFMSHPRWQRFLIAIAGPAMNILLALVVLTCLYTVHHDYNAFLHAPVDVLWVTPGSQAAQAGIQRGDRIVSVQGDANPDWKKLLDAEVIPNQPLQLRVQHGNSTRDVTVVPQPKGPDQVGDIGLGLPVVVGQVEAGGAAENAGVQANDVLVTVDSKEIRDLEDLLNYLQTTKQQPVQLTVLRDTREVAFNLAPTLRDGKYRLGLRPIRVEKLPFKAAAYEAYTDCKENSLLIFKLVGGMLQRKVSIKQMSGPVGIMKISSDAAASGWPPYLFVMALISLNLAIFNLLPIPILDGGLILMLLIEGVMRRDIKQEIKERVYQAAFVFLILFAAVVIYNDIAKSFHG